MSNLSLRSSPTKRSLTGSKGCFHPHNSRCFLLEIRKDSLEVCPKLTIMKRLLQTISAVSGCLLFFLCSAQDSTRYKYFIGTNFDFIDGLQAQKLYHHVNVSIPDAFFKPGNKTKGLRAIGFIGGIYQTRQVSSTDTINYLNRGNSLRQQVTYPANDPTNARIVLVDSVFLQRSTSTKALGAYFQPTFLFGDSAETNLYLIGHLEYAHRTIEQKYVVSYKPTDTLTILKSDLSRYPSAPSNQTTKQTQDEGYFGAGLMVYHKNRFVEIMIKGVLGAATFDKWRPFYSIDASIVVLKGNFELGLSYKGLLPNYPPYFLNVHLTKVFYLDKIGELLQ